MKQYTITETSKRGRAVFTVCRVLESYPYPVPVGGRAPCQFYSLNAALDRLHELTQGARHDAL